MGKICLSVFFRACLGGLSKLEQKNCLFFELLRNLFFQSTLNCLIGGSVVVGQGGGFPKNK